MAYNFGVDQNDMVLTLVGFASQHEFFNLLSLDADGTLAWLAYTFGMIGFLLLLLLPASWDLKYIASWLVLFLIVLVRPIGEPLFFSNPDSDAAVSQVDTIICYGNALDGRECADVAESLDVAAMGSASNLTMRNAAERQAPIEVDTDAADAFKVFSPQAALIDLLNDLNYGISTQLSNLGPRSIDRQFAAIETVRRNSQADTFAAYAISDFLASCGARNPAFARVASLSTTDVLAREGATWEAMMATPMKFADGIQLFRNYDAYRRNLSPELQRIVYPSLICAPGTCDGGSGDGASKNLYDEDPNPIIEEDEFNEFRKSILFEDVDDFIRVASPGSGDVPSGVTEANINLSAGLSNLGDTAIEDALNQQVSLIVPINMRAAISNGSIENAANLGNLDGFWEMLQKTAEAAGLLGAITGGGLGAWAAVVIGGIGCAGASILTGGLAALPCFMALSAGVAAIGLGAYVGYATGTAVGNAAIDALDNRVPFGDDEGAYVVSNCAQFHRLTDARIRMATTERNYLKRQLEEILEDNSEILRTESFAGLQPQEQTAAILQTIIRHGEEGCMDIERESRREACIERETGRAREIMSLNSRMSRQASHPLAEIMVENASDPEFNAVSRNVVSSLGGFLAPAGISLKAMVGGFGAGTYSEIMPRIVSFATALVIILTPLIFMLGLLVPTWSFGVMVMSIVVIAYFMMTKIVFSMIGIVMGVFIAARESGVIGSETADFADLVIGFAYTSAFILTGLFMFSLKNPLAAIQQVAGSADKVSTISGSEAIGMALAGAKIAGAIKGGPAAIAGAMGSMKGAADSGEGVMGQVGAVFSGGKDNSMLTNFARSRDETMRGLAETKTDVPAMLSRSKDEYNAAAAGRFKNAEEDELVGIAKGRGASSMTHSQTAVVDRNGKKLEINSDDAVRAIYGAMRKGGHDAKDAMLKMYDHASDSPGGNINGKSIYQLDREALANEGAVRYNVEVSALNAGGIDSAGIQGMVDKGLGKMSDDGKHFIIEESAGSGKSIFDT